MTKPLVDPLETTDVLSKHKRFRKALARDIEQTEAQKSLEAFANQTFWDALKWLAKREPMGLR